MIDIAAPVIVFGDIHGQLADLLRLESIDTNWMIDLILVSSIIVIQLVLQSIKNVNSDPIWLFSKSHSKQEIYNLMNELKKQGIAVMFVSSEMPEVMGIADRIIVMCDGRITGEVSAREATQDEILTMATSFENKGIKETEGGNKNE